VGEKGIRRAAFCLTIKTLLYVIIYPLAIELFAFRKDRCAVVNGINLGVTKRWTILDRFRGCKNFCDHYNATPLLEAMIVRTEALKSDLNLLIAFVGYSLL
jgi:hypothetical protein